MKLTSKTWTIILGSVAAVGTIAGAIMFGVGGNQTSKIEQGGLTYEYPSGWLNYDSSKLGGATFEQYLEQAKEGQKMYPDQIKSLEDTIAALESSDPSNASLPQLKTQLKSFQDQLNSYNTTLSMYSLAIAGVVIMSVGLGIGVITAAMAFYNFKKVKKS